MSNFRLYMGKYHCLWLTFTLYERGFTVSEQALVLYLSSFALYEEGVTLYGRARILSKRLFAYI